MKKVKQNEQLVAFIGPDMEIEGSIRFKGSIRVDGKLKGEINGNGSLVVGDTGHIEAIIKSDNVLIRGYVKGDIEANKLELLTPGKVYGNIKTKTLVMEEGVIFEGNCHMEGEREAKKLTSISPKAKENKEKKM